MLRDKQAWLHSAKAYMAAALALFIALRFQLPRPYWAMGTAYIVIQPMLGGTRSRGRYRIFGTLIAAGVAVALVPNLVHTPLLLAFTLSLWLALCSFAAQVKRGPSSYIFMLAGYTASIIAFPTFAQPESIFDVAISRSGEIVVGALSAIFISAIVFPASIKPSVRRRVDGLMRDAGTWCAQVLEHKGSPTALRKRLAGDLQQLDAIIPFAKRDDPRHGELHEWLQDLRARLLGLLPVLASIESRLDSLGAPLDDELKHLIDEVRAWVRLDTLPTLEDFVALRERIRRTRPVVGTDSDSLLRNSLLLRLGELVEMWYDSRQLQASIHHGHTPPPPMSPLDLRSLTGFDELHRDWGMITFSALTAGATMFLYCAIVMVLGWPGAVSSGAMVGVAAAFFAAQDDPAPGLHTFLLGMIISVFGAGIYLFVIGPYIHDFGQLLLALLPWFLFNGLLMSDPKRMSLMLLLIVNVCNLLSIDNLNRVDFDNFANSSLSTLLGLLFALVLTRVFRSVSAEWTARRLVRQGWQLLAAAAEGHGQEDRDRFMVRMLDLLGLLAPRMVALPAQSDIAAIDMLDEARIGLNILNLRRARRDLPESNRTRVNALLDAVAVHYRAQERAGRAQPPPQELRSALDASLLRLGALPAGTPRDETLIGLIGLRYGLFPRQQLAL